MRRNNDANERLPCDYRSLAGNKKQVTWQPNYEKLAHMSQRRQKQSPDSGRAPAPGGSGRGDVFQMALVGEGLSHHCREILLGGTLNKGRNRIHSTDGAVEGTAGINDSG